MLPLPRLRSWWLLGAFVPCALLACSGGTHPTPTVPTLHRPAASPCTEPRAAGDMTDCTLGVVDDNTGDGGDGGVLGCPWLGMSGAPECTIGCTDDTSCAGGANGRCGCAWGAAPNPWGTACSYDDCASDDACGHTVCLCRETTLPGVTPDPARRTICAGSGNCKVDSDCGGGGYCAPTAAFQCGPDRWDYYGFFCHTPNDECVNDSDCAPQGNAFCAYNPAVKHWACSTGTCFDG